jgi:phospholipid transport system transporter-binding protein
MPSSSDGGARVTRDGDALRFAGGLSRDQVARLWPQALAALDGVRRFDLAAVGVVDSAGLALLAELAGRLGGVAIDGNPPGLAELRSAYRLDLQLGFATQ